MTDAARVFPADVEVAVVSHNGRATLPEVLACLEAAGIPPGRLTVVDIASTDGTGAWLEAARPDVRLLALPDNRGPNPARNAALAAAAHPYLVLLDSDAYVRPDTIPLLRLAMASADRVGAVVPVVVHADQPASIQYAGSALHFLCEAVGGFADRPLAERGPSRLDIGTAPGLCMLLDVAVARRLGGFDDRYFMGKEDGEFCYRLRLAGYRIVEDPAAVVRHASRPRSTWLFPFQVRNRWHFMLKNYEARTLLVLVPALVIHEPLQFVLLAVRGHAGAWFAGLRGLWPLLSSLPGDRRRVRQSRLVHDRELLSLAPLVMRADLIGGSIGARMKRWYDTWLAAYWRLVRGLLP